MKVKILDEQGHEHAMLGLSLSYRQPVSKMPAVARRLAGRDDGHNKFLESIVVWLDVTAPRYWWQQMDTYRIGVTKQSESTMHTLMKEKITQDDFENPVDERILSIINELIAGGPKGLQEVKNLLPEGFLQRRVICTNYKALRHVIKQRRSHRLAEWKQFINEVMAQVRYPEYLEDLF